MHYNDLTQVYTSVADCADSATENLCKVAMLLKALYNSHYSFKIGPGDFACATRVAFVMCSWPLLLPSFSLSNFFLFPSFAFDPLRRKLPRLNICVPQYFGITSRYMQNNCNFYFFTKTGSRVRTLAIKSGKNARKSFIS